MSGFVGARNYGLEDSKEIERIFFSDVREKKRAGSGAFHKTGKGVKHKMSGIKFASDTLRGKEKKEYKGTTKVRAYNMNDFIPKQAFLQLSEEDQKKRLMFWRDKYSNTEIMEGCGFNKNDIYDLIAKLGIPKKTRKAGNIQEITMSQEELEKVKKDPSQLYNWDRFKALPIPQRDEVILHWTQTMNWQAVDLVDLIKGAEQKDLYQAAWSARDRKKKQEAKEAEKQKRMEAINKAVEEEPKQNTFTFEEIEGTGANMKVKETLKERAARLKEQEEANRKWEEEKRETRELIQGIQQRFDQMEAEKQAPAPQPAQTDISEFWEQLKQMASTAMEPKEDVKAETHGFYLTQNGEYMASELERRLQNVINIIHGSNSKYELKLELIEVEPPKPIEAQAEEVDEPQQPPAKALAEAFANLGTMLNKSFYGGNEG